MRRNFCKSELKANALCLEDQEKALSLVETFQVYAEAGQHRVDSHLYYKRKEIHKSSYDELKKIIDKVRELIFFNSKAVFYFLKM